jgi:drug/metabolite transporter (DMT)-like permease
VSATVLAAMLASALLHASWNAWVKSRADPYGALMAIAIGAAWPNLILLAFAGPPPAAAWGWIALTIALSVPAQTLLGAAYREGDLAVAYPLVRGLNPLVLALAAVPVFGERLAPAQLAGVAWVSGGIALLGWEAAQRSRTMTLRGLGFAALAALSLAAGVLADSIGMRAADDPLSYGPIIAIGNGAALAAYQARRIDVRRVLASHWQLALFAPLLSTASYLLFVWSIGEAPVALVTSLRETSVLFAVALGALLLRERVSRLHWLAVAVVFAGVLAIRS